jgi:hypothetical protein
MDKRGNAPSGGLRIAFHGKLRHGTLGFAGTSEQLPFQPEKLRGGGEKTKPGLVANHDARGPRTDLDNLAV